MARRDALSRLQQVLLNRRSDLRKRLGLELEQLSHEGGSGDAADMAFGATNEELASHLAEIESRELSQIELALMALKNGDYGTCNGCHGKIPVVRLNALPYSTLCIDCQRRAEKDRSWQPQRMAPRWHNLRDAGPERNLTVSQLEAEMS